MSKIVGVTMLSNGKRFPRCINSRFVVRMSPGIPMPLETDDGYVNVPTTVVTMPGEEFVVQGLMHVIAARLNGEEEG